jgi:hypothetical protein
MSAFVESKNYERGECMSIDNKIAEFCKHHIDELEKNFQKFIPLCHRKNI